MTKDKIMTKTKDQQAQQYAEKKIESEYGISREDFIEAGCRFGYNDVVQAYSDGYCPFSVREITLPNQEVISYAKCDVHCPDFTPKNKDNGE